MEFCKTFTKILQFNEDLPLNTDVVSDHAEIIAKTPYGDVACWNISNPLHHHYFGMIDTYTFSKTHMFTDKNWLSSKIDLQISSIVEDLISGKVISYIIVEGYLEFYRKLELLLYHLIDMDKIPGGSFGVFYDKDPPIVGRDDKNLINVTGLVVNLDIFNVKQFKLYSEIYEEEGDVIKTGEARQKRSFNIPVLYLESVYNADEILVLGGIHIHGSNSRNPKTGLSLLSNTLLDIKNNFDTVGSKLFHILFMGDFNTIPKNVGDALKLVLGRPSPFRIKLTDYPTMVNPRSEVSFYDMVISYPDQLVTLKSLDETNTFTRALLESVCRSRDKYLSVHK